MCRLRDTGVTTASCRVTFSQNPRYDTRVRADIRSGQLSAAGLPADCPRDFAGRPSRKHVTEQPVRVHHLALGARDVARVSEFYRTVFELPERARYYHADDTLRSVWLSAEGTLLMIELSDQPESAQAGSIRPGLFLIAFEASAERRSLLEQRLEARGAHIERRTEFTSYTRDPEGNQVAISHFPERQKPTDPE